MKQFTRWALMIGRISSDPLVTVTPPSPHSSRKIERRAFAVPEWQFLQATTAQQGVEYGMTGAGRALLYETSLQTGLRANELRELTTSNFGVADPPFVLASRRSTKNKQTARQYITRSLLDRLLKYSADRQLVFPALTINTATMIVGDIEIRPRCVSQSQPQGIEV